MAHLLFAVFVAVLLAGASQARILSRCQIANEMRQHGFPEYQIRDWVCLVEGESSGNTAAEGRLNTDDSVDYGLFQINSQYWCGQNGAGGGCNIACSSLVNDDISDDVACVRTIYNVHGFAGWVAWKNKCNGQTLPDISSC